MGNTNGALRLVNVLSARAAAAVGVYLQVLVRYFDINVGRFGKNRNRNGACVDTPLAFGIGNALNAVNAAFKLKLAVRAVANHRKRAFLQSAELVFFHVDFFYFPTVFSANI